MWRSKKFIIIVAVVAAVVLVGGIGGIAYAQNSDDSQPKARCGAMLDKVCEIYQEKTGVAIDQEALKDAFMQAAGEMRPEGLQKPPKMGPEAMQDRLQNLVTEGKLTQEQLDALQEWWDSKPDVPFGPPGPGMFHKHGGFPGMGGPPCAPPPSE